MQRKTLHSFFNFESLIHVLLVYNPTNGLPQGLWTQRLALAALGWNLGVLYLSRSGETLAHRSAWSRRSVRFCREGPTAAFCHVSIIQSDVWVICFSILKSSHINSSHQEVCHPTFWASEEIRVLICNHVFLLSCITCAGRSEKTINLRC